MTEPAIDVRMRGDRISAGGAPRARGEVAARRADREAGTALRWGRFDAEGFGPLWLGWTDRGLARLDFDRPGEGAAGDVAGAPVPERFAAPLWRYFAGAREDFKAVPLDLRGTAFQRAVWAALREVPYGAVCSYATIAARIGNPRAMRAVGAANGKNPVAIIVPCHRIVEAGGGLGGYTGGLERKRFLLAREGTRVIDGRVQPGQLDLF